MASLDGVSNYAIPYNPQVFILSFLRDKNLIDMKSLIGRHTEIAKLKAAAISQRVEFVALYGRRRVGKTFLIIQMFEPGFISQKSSFRELP
ncbi:MAG: hypothetical protein IKO56_04335, partial [Alphaproteobacteria bacterium]|nr:hypothetical protein [Alphaproteobacteria bacterium]